MLPIKIGYRTGRVDAAIIAPQTNNSMAEKKRTHLPYRRMPAARKAVAR
jgi:hypothetical protein